MAHSYSFLFLYIIQVTQLLHYHNYLILSPSSRWLKTILLYYLDYLNLFDKSSFRYLHVNFEWTCIS